MGVPSSSLRFFFGITLSLFSYFIRIKIGLLLTFRERIFNCVVSPLQSCRILSSFYREQIYLRLPSFIILYRSKDQYSCFIDGFYRLSSISGTCSSIFWLS